MTSVYIGLDFPHPNANICTSFSLNFLASMTTDFKKIFWKIKKRGILEKNQTLRMKLTSLKNDTDKKQVQVSAIKLRLRINQESEQ